MARTNSDAKSLNGIKITESAPADNEILKFNAMVKPLNGGLFYGRDKLRILF